MKKFKGKALYQPSGKAAEYAAWAVNYYTGCSNDCEYCYCKRGVLGHVWHEKPVLKRCFNKKWENAIDIFEKELLDNLEQVKREGGIFLSFTTDPLLRSTSLLTGFTIDIAAKYGVPVTLLTKSVDWGCYSLGIEKVTKEGFYINIGFTLTGFDNKEPNAAPNLERIKKLKQYHKKGYKTWVSIEPVIDPYVSLSMIERTLGYCDMYKVGLLSGAGNHYYEKEDMEYFFLRLYELSKENRIYLKDSFLKYFGIKRENLPSTFATI